MICIYLIGEKNVDLFLGYENEIIFIFIFIFEIFDMNFIEKWVKLVNLCWIFYVYIVYVFI